MSAPFAAALALASFALAFFAALPSLWAKRRADVLAAAAVFVIALLMQSMVPWGPLEFCEGDRLRRLWGGPGGMSEEWFAAPTTLLAAAMAAGLSLLEVLRWAGSLLSALGIALVFVCARAGGFGVSSASLAAVIVALWPAHLRYGVTSTSMMAPAAWMAVFAAALSTTIAPWQRVVLVGSGAVIGALSRPEMLLLVAPLLPLVFAPQWTWPDRIATAAILAAGLTLYALGLLHGAATPVDYPWSGFWHFVLHEWTVNPVEWMAAAAVGLVLGKYPSRHLQAAIWIGVALLTFAFSRFASEANPLFGVWRNLIALLPFAALAIAALAERVVPHRRREVVIAGLAIFAAVSLGWRCRSVAFRPIDGQTEFAYMLETTERIAAQYPEIILVTKADVPPSDFATDGMRGIPYESNPRFAIGLRLGLVDPPSGCEGARGSRPFHLWSVAALREGCKNGPPPEKAVIYLGLFRPPHLIESLEQRYRLEPVDKRQFAVASTMWALDDQCPFVFETWLGSKLADCTVELGWYHLIPR